MSIDEFGPWEPLELCSVVDHFSSATFRWWITGGRALGLHLGRSWRPHEDTDVGVIRSELGALHALLRDWDLHIAAAGTLSSWRGEPLEAARSQNNVWCPAAPDGPWMLDITIGEGSAECWVYRRDPSIQLPWDSAVLLSAEGIPYLAPELQLLFKSKNPRPKDDVDAAEVIPSLDTHQREFLSRLVGPDHPWQRRLS